MRHLRQSTAITLKLGPFMDATDGVTPEDTLVIQKANLRLSKNGGNMAAADADQGVADAGAPHDEIGLYDASLSANDTDTLGHLRVDVQMAGAGPVWHEFMVLPQQVWDSMYGADRLQVDVREMNGSANAAQQIERSSSAIISGAVVAGTLTTTQMATNLLFDHPDMIEDAAVYFRTGTLAGTRRLITAATEDGVIQFEAAPVAPEEDDEFDIL